ncbi:MAG: OsmC family protein [Clostridiales bacterium]|nr:OsmC family protein [Clostridiales bacterium]
MADIKFNINAHSESPSKTIVEARSFKMIVDEPQNLGGTDAGANPVEYVLAALAGCLNVVGHLVAKEMNFELRGIELEIEGNLDPSKLMGVSMKERAGYKEVRVLLNPDTDADKETLDKWVTIVESRCPVSDNVANETPVKISLK